MAPLTVTFPNDMAVRTPVGTDNITVSRSSPDALVNGVIEVGQTSGVALFSVTVKVAGVRITIGTCMGSITRICDVALALTVWLETVTVSVRDWDVVPVAV